MTLRNTDNISYNDSLQNATLRTSNNIQFYLSVRKVIGLIMYPIVFCFGLPANIIGVIVLSRRKMRSTTTILLLFLTVSDLLKIIDDILYSICIFLQEMVDYETGNTALHVLYPYAHYIFNATMFCNAWMTVSIAIERYIYVCHSKKSKYLCTNARALVVSFSIIFVSFAIALPYGFRYQVEYYASISEDGVQKSVLLLSKMWEEGTFPWIYNYIFYMFRTMIPIILLLSFSILILLRLKRTRIRTRSKRRATLSLTLVMVFFIICVFPDTILSTCFHFGYYEAGYLVKGIREITDFMLLFNSATNFFIYCIFNTKFREHVKEMF